MSERNPDLEALGRRPSALDQAIINQRERIRRLTDDGLPASQAEQVLRSFERLRAAAGDVF